MQKRHVIVLAQGQQNRLPELPCPKQMMALPLCAGVPIIARTLMMVRELDPIARITVVCKRGMYEPMFHWRPRAAAPDDGNALDKVLQLAGDIELEQHELPDPGNSSLKGLGRYLDHRHDVIHQDALDFDPAQTVVLLGDCVYSWRCMGLLFSDAIPYNFVGTSNLSESDGELWGITWRKDAHDPLIQWLKKALRKHPPFAAYQCGQLRQWLFTARAELDPQPVLYTSVDDYTKDFDVPADLEVLYQTSGRAGLDDALHFIRWPTDEGQ